MFFVKLMARACMNKKLATVDVQDGNSACLLQHHRETVAHHNKSSCDEPHFDENNPSEPVDLNHDCYAAVLQCHMFACPQLPKPRPMLLARVLHLPRQLPRLLP
jgi:hypothetical protein